MAALEEGAVRADLEFVRHERRSGAISRDSGVEEGREEEALVFLRVVHALDTALLGLVCAPLYRETKRGANPVLCFQKRKKSLFALSRFSPRGKKSVERRRRKKRI